jgi:hypothetical protein
LVGVPVCIGRNLETYILLCSISSQASTEKGDGHFYWNYRALSAKGNSPGFASGCVLGPKKESSLGDGAVLNDSAVEDRFSPNLFSSFRYPFGGLEQAVDRRSQLGFNKYQFYEGSLVDLVCVLFLAPRFPESVFFFNFFWTREWMHLWEKRPLLWRLIESCLAKGPENIILMADTELFADQVMRRSKLHVIPYPNFSPFDFPPTRPQSKRSIDVLVTCKREFELDFALETLSLLDIDGTLRLSFLLPEKLSNPTKFELLGQRHSIRVFSKTLSEHSYVKLLADSKVVFLSYLKDHYLYGSSGKLADLALAGCRGLVPAGSGLASQGKSAPEHMLENFHSADPGDAARKLRSMLLLSEESTPWGRDVDGFLAKISAFEEPAKPMAELPAGRLRNAVVARLWIVVLAASTGYRGIPRGFFSHGLGLRLARIAIKLRRLVGKIAM